MLRSFIKEAIYVMFHYSVFIFSQVFSTFGPFYLFLHKLLDSLFQGKKTETIAS